MFRGSIDIDGGNYVIKSSSIYVPNMENEVDKVSKFVKDKGGSHRDSDIRENKLPNGMRRGYFRGISFRYEFFLEGIIITLSGNTPKEQKYFVNHSRRDLHGDLRSGWGVGLNEFDEYYDYERKRVNGEIEQDPKLTDPGYIHVTLEGAVRHLAKDAPEFFAVTGLAEGWPMPLMLVEPEKPKSKEDRIRDQTRSGLLFYMDILEYSKEAAMKEFPEVLEKYGEAIFNEVWKPKRSKKKKAIKGSAKKKK